jgi:MFS family permease
VEFECRPAKGRKWFTIGVLVAAELLSMGVWFSASAVVPALSAAWGLHDAGRAGLTLAVQAGFAVGALLLAIFNLADRTRPDRLLAVSALAAATFTAMIPALSDGLASALCLRFLTGFCLAGVYPVGMKIVATWTKTYRGLGIGLLVGALTIGSAGPQLLNAVGGLRDWKFVLYAAAALAAAGGCITAQWVRTGPYGGKSARFRWDYVRVLLGERALLLANLGYLGHMWELYAMWAWLALYLTAALHSAVEASWLTFAAIASGGPSSVLAGWLADRWGRTRTTALAMAISGACALGIGCVFDAGLPALGAVALLWGFAVVADSAQFSACTSELCEPEYIGTALALQNSLGFFLTMVTIRLAPQVERWVGTRWSLAFLAIGPAMGIMAMLALRRRPESVRIAGGRG